MEKKGMMDIVEFSNMYVVFNSWSMIEILIHQQMCFLRSDVRCCLTMVDLLTVGTDLLLMDKIRFISWQVDIDDIVNTSKYSVINYNDDDI